MTKLFTNTAVRTSNPVVVPSEEFNNDLIDSFFTTSHPHGFVALHQAQVLTKCKES
jgi:hypothetical protein